MRINNENILQLRIMFGTLTQLNRPKEIDEVYVENTLELILKLTPDLILSIEDIIQLKKDIYTEYQIKQDDGTLIVDDYEHEPWYSSNKEMYSSFHWERYKRYLITKNFPMVSIDKLEKTLDEIIDSLGNPNVDASFLRRGLIIGDVQSGKTSNYIGLINKAADVDYKVIILLTGTIESLRKQTQIRVEEGFIGFDSIKQQRVGVGLDNGIISAEALTSRNNDFTNIADKNTVLSLAGSNKKLILIVKKNTTVLEKLYNAFKSINTSKLHPEIDHPLLLIDDEADNASINTNKPENDPTRTNKAIRKLLKLFKKSNYVGFTATPFANVFIDPSTEEEMLGSDLFPENFIYSLEAPSNYIGAKKVFAEDNNIIRYIDDENEDIFSHSHKKNWCGDHFFDSLNYAIYTFLIANLIRDYKGDVKSHRSMLINVSRFVAVQFQIKNIVLEILSEAIQSIKYYIHRADDIALKNNIIADIYDVWFKEYKENISWLYVKDNLYESVKDIKTIVVNSSSSSEKLDYDNEKDGLRIIAIGGLALSRGLTLEGLMISYFYRNTSTFDVLMQMGRWFGYRGNYEELCRVWITMTSAEWYQEISEATELLKNDVRDMRTQKKKPTEFGIRVRNDSIELGITSKNKMRATFSKVDRLTYYGEVFEAPYLMKDLDMNSMHFNTVKELSSKISNRNHDVKQPYFNDVDPIIVKNFISKLMPSEYSTRFDVKQIMKFLDGNFAVQYHKWDILFMEGRNDDQTKLCKINESLSVVPIQRSFDIVDDNVVRVSGSRARLGAKEDTKIGLTEEQLHTAIKWADKNNQGKFNAKTYLVEGRNPLLIIYLIKLLDGSKNWKDFVADLDKQDTPFVGFSLAFPRADGISSNDAHVYVVNRKANFYLLQEISNQGESDDENE